jgi:hypothetical protein
MMVANNPKYPPPTLTNKDTRILPTSEKNTSYFDVFNPFSEKRKLIKAWNKRNIQNAEVYLHAIDIEDKVIIFQQNIFIKHDTELEITLRRQGFKPLFGFPDEKLFEKFSSIFWNKQFNIAISFVKPELDDIVKTSYEIATKHIEDNETSLTIFLSTIEILTAKTGSSCI